MWGKQASHGHSGVPAALVLWTPRWGVTPGWPLRWAPVPPGQAVPSATSDTAVTSRGGEPGGEITNRPKFPKSACRHKAGKIQGPELTLFAFSLETGRKCSCPAPAPGASANDTRIWNELSGYCGISPRPRVCRPAGTGTWPGCPVKAERPGGEACCVSGAAALHF